MKRGIIAVLVAAAVFAGGAASASPQGKTSICHRTASDSNPYVLITVNDNALSAHIGPEAHPAKNGREDYVASSGELEQGFCGEVAPETAKYRLVRRMKFLETVFIGEAGLGVEVTCDGTDFIVTFGGEDEVRVPVGEARRDTILRVRSAGIVLVKVRESEVC